MLKIFDTLPALKHKNYKIYLSGQFVSLIGTWMQQLAMSWMIYRLTNSAFWLGVSGFASQIPLFLFGLFAGVIVDHVDRHKLLIWTQSLSALQAFILAALTFSGKINLTELIMLNFTLGLINCFDITGRQSFVVQMIKKHEDLPNAIALNSSIVNMTRLIGPAIAGASIALVGEGMCFLINGVSYIAVLIALFFIKVEKVKNKKFRINKIFENISIGYHSTFDNSSMSFVILFVAFISFFATPYLNLLPALAATLSGSGAHTLGLLSASTGLGSLVGALYLAYRKGPPDLGGIIAFGGLNLAVFLVVLSRVQFLPYILIATFMAGLGMMLQLSSTNTVIQILVEDDKRGRVMSFLTLALFGTAPFGSLLMGYMAEHLGLHMTFLINGLISVVGAYFFVSKASSINAQIIEHVQIR
ncbi:MAG: MFS transporter [Bacteriovorax sp.]|nr:MFS transporter [Bacteriovorax sp.]